MAAKYDILSIYLDESVVKSKGDIADKIEGVLGLSATNKAMRKMASDILDERNSKCGKPLAFEDAWTEFSNKKDGRAGYNPKPESGIRKIIRAIPKNFKITI